MIGPSGRTALELDPGIIPLLDVLNERGYTTVWSCSGLIQDHPGGLCNMFSRHGEFAKVGNSRITFPSSVVSGELRRLFTRHGFSVRQTCRNPKQTTATLRDRKPDADILRIFESIIIHLNGN